MPHQEINADGSRTVLVVDDEPSVRVLIALLLDLEGYTILEAEDGQSALERAAVEPVALITLDVMMPGMDGWEVADALDAKPGTRGIPRLMISAKPIDELMRACGTRQAAGMITKPFLPDVLVSQVARIAGACELAA